MQLIADTAIVYPGVELGKNVIVEDFCMIGIPFNGMCNNHKTTIADGAVIRAGTYIYAGNIIGENFQTGNKANIRELNTIGNDVSIGTLSVIEHHVEIHDRVRIHSQVFIPEYSVLANDCWIGPNVVVTNAKYPKHQNVKQELVGAQIGVNAKVGANATILPGVSIGGDCLIGAGSVVTKDTNPSMIIIGNPAKELREIDY